MVQEVVSLIPQYDKNRNEYFLSKNGEYFWNDDISAFFLPAGIYSQLRQSAGSQMLEVPLLNFPCIDHNKIVRYNEIQLSEDLCAVLFGVPSIRSPAGIPLSSL